MIQKTLLRRFLLHCIDGFRDGFKQGIWGIKDLLGFLGVGVFDGFRAVVASHQGKKHGEG